MKGLNSIYKKMKRYFPKKNVKNFRSNFPKIGYLHVQNFLKIWFKIFEKYFLKVTLHFLVEDGKPTHLLCELVSTVNYEGGVGFFLLALQTNRRTDGRTYTFLKSLRHTDSNGIQHSVVAWINTDRQQNNMSPQ